MSILIDILSAGAIDDQGDALDSGVVYVYEVGTTTPVAVYSDDALTLPVANPITLDSAGKAEVYVNQKVRLVIEDSDGNTVDDIESYGGQATLANISDDILPDTDDAYSIGSSAKRFANIRSVDLNISENAYIDLLARVGANTPGWMNNLGINLLSGVFSITGVDGVALATGNPGYISAPSITAGRIIPLKVTAGGTFNDDSHASSSLGNLGWGITESQDWANDMPFFLYIVNRNDNDVTGLDGDSVFALARSPVFNTTPSSANDIGNNSTIPATDSQTAMLLMSAVTVANYVSLPCQLIGAIRMQWSTTTDDWTVQTLGNADGLGEAALRKMFSKTWTMPLRQNGAAASTFFKANGGTAPLFTVNEYKYKLHPDGRVSVVVNIDSDPGTDGAGAVTAQMAIPYAATTGFATGTVFGRAHITNAGLTAVGVDVRLVDTETHCTFQQTDGTDVTNANFSNGSRSVEAFFTYPAYAP